MIERTELPFYFYHFMSLHKMLSFMKKFALLFIYFIPLWSFAQLKTDVLVIGGGASGVMAGIQAARLGIKVTIIEEGTWLGGMLTSAGVSAIDGNHHLPSGLWAEFKNALVKHYGTAQPYKQVG